MAEPFKHLIDDTLVRLTGGHLGRVWPAFDRRRFESLALAGLADLEMKARAMHIADALEATLPDDFGRAAAILEASLGPPGEGDDLSLLRAGPQGLAGWIVWPMGEFVARRGQAQPERALAALHAMTQRFSAEFAIRPFIARHPELCFAAFAHWCRDPSAHVRRLVSEGSRPRLPWGLRLTALVADPSPTLPLLEALMDDPSAYVRRSVANHLNDIAKDHPDRVVTFLQRHLPPADDARRALLRHACRTLIKSGHPAALAAWGLGRPLRGDATLTLSAHRVVVGEVLTVEVSLRSSSNRSQPLEIDYAVHHVKADGRRSPKVFKGWRLELGAGEHRTLVKRHSLRPVTTRRYHAGEHALDLRINGRIVAQAGFRLVVRPDAPNPARRSRR